MRLQKREIFILRCPPQAGGELASLLPYPEGISRAKPLASSNASRLLALAVGLARLFVQHNFALAAIAAAAAPIAQMIGAGVLSASGANAGGFLAANIA